MACARSTIKADKLPTANIFLAMRVKDLTYSADLPLSASLRASWAATGGRPISAARSSPAPATSSKRYARLSDDDRLGGDECRVGFQPPRAGGASRSSPHQRVTLLAHLSRNGNVTDWQPAFGGPSVRRRGRAALIFNRIQHRLPLRYRQEARAADAGRPLQWRDQRRRHRRGRLFRRAALQLRLCRHADVASPERCGRSLIAPEVRELGDRADREGAACSAIRHRHQFPRCATSRARGRRFRMKGFGQYRRLGRDGPPVDQMPAVRDADLKARGRGAPCS